MISIGNPVALLALLVWPLVVFAFFRALSVERALIWSILGGYMLLPQLTEINLPGIPGFNKETIPNLAAFAGCVFVLGRFPTLLPAGWAGRALLAAFVISPAVTVLTNLEPMQFGVTTAGSLQMLDTGNLQRGFLPGLRAYDSASSLVQQLIAILPFFLARHILNTAEALRELLVALVIAGLIYSLPMLFEVRFSPQLHTWIYGFFQHDFSQSIRFGGFRPIVFMPHGIWVAFFAFMCAMAAAAMLREAPSEQRGRMTFLLLFMLGLVVICKTMGAFMMTLVFLPVLLLLRPQRQLAFAGLVAAAVLAYPLLRGSGLVPVNWILAQVAAIEPDRAASLAYRFDNENLILAHVEQKMLFGWGGWGRFMPHNPLTGTSDVVVDGSWIITIGQAGWLGFIAQFGLLTLPLLSLWKQARKPSAPPVPLAVSAVALILAANLLDLLPNDTLIPFTWLMAGGLLGYAEGMARATAPAPARTMRQPRGAPPPRADVPAQSKVPPKRRTIL